MKPVEIISNSLFWRTQDGRIIFRPWGTRGACYLLTESQRINRARIQLAYYAGLLVCIFLMGDSIERLGIMLGLFMAGNYILYWLFARKLPTTEAPGMPDPEFARQRCQEINSNFGKPALWGFLLLSAAMALAGLLAGLLLGEFLPVLSAAFFGFCAFVFARRLNSI
jgi:ABC-type nitrate/sulfonate/bicarbonate transport system permease component